MPSHPRRVGLPALALVVAGGGLLPAFAPSPAAAAGSAAGKVTTSKVTTVKALPDRVSALLQAKGQGSRVEITDDRTETTTTWANPDGSLTTDSAVSPVRAKDANGEWHPVDYSLVPVAGGFAPKSSPVDVTFSGGGTGPAATARKGSKQLDLSWSGKLPKPTVEGNHATYRLDDSTSLVLAATRPGWRSRSS